MKSNLTYIAISVAAIRVNLDETTRPAAWQATDASFTVSESSQTDGSYSRFLFRPEEGRLTALEDGRSREITVIDRLPSEYVDYEEAFE